MCAVFAVEEGDLPHREIVSLQKKEDSGAVKEGGEEDGHLPHVSQESFLPVPDPDPESTQMTTNSVNASEVPQVSQSQETIVPRRSSEKPAKKARRAFEL
jgi:hypothetical protein